jgi:EAL and modified HD-GYP domain-containing signal transduction protein
MTELIDIYIGRQPIFNAKLAVHAYELLFRNNSEQNHAELFDSTHDKITAQLMMHTFGEIGLKDIAGDNKVFINFTEGLLLRENMAFFPPNQVVIEVLENIKVTPALLRSLKELREQGFTIALDDYVFNPELRALEQYADLIKVDILQVGPKLLTEHAKRLKNSGLRLLAEKVETREQFEFCRNIGFDYFQGYFFARPQIIKGRRLPTNKLTVLELMSNVYDPNVDIKKLSSLIARDVSLSQKLLKFLAESVPTKYPITSVHDGVLRFGLHRLQSWTSMLALAGMDDKPTELFRLSLIRAKFCELVGEQLKDPSKDMYFTVGLFSVLDAIMDQTLSELLDKLNLDNRIILALTQPEDNPMGQTLLAIKALEHGKTQFTRPNNVCPTELSKHYLHALQYAQGVYLGNH